MMQKMNLIEFISRLEKEIEKRKFEVNDLEAFLKESKNRLEAIPENEQKDAIIERKKVTNNEGKPEFMYKVTS